MSRAAQWMFNGMVFGYPDCCIVNFVERGAEIHNTGRSERGVPFLDDNGVATGYVMCPMCANRPREELIADINENRAPFIGPFPNQSVQDFSDVVF